MFESLEGRILLHTNYTTIINTQLAITGSAAVDVFTVTQDKAGIHVLHTGHPPRTFDSNLVHYIGINGFAGDDIIKIAPNVDIPAWINGGSGNDLVQGGAAKDTLLGGDGNDTINGEGGADQISGEGGNDSLIGGSGNDTLLGGSGNDALASKDNERDLLNGGAGKDVARSDKIDILKLVP